MDVTRQRFRRSGSGSRRGVSLVEVLTVVAIIAVLIGVLLPAVYKIRLSAARTAGANQSRQIGLAILGFSSANHARLPALDGGPQSANPNWSMFQVIIPFAGFDAEWHKTRTEGAACTIRVGLYLGVNDPTLTADVLKQQVIDYCSYAANGQVFFGKPRTRLGW